MPTFEPRSWYEQRTFGDLPREAARRFGGRCALVFEHERYTFSELAERIDAAAKGFMVRGVSPGEHVALWLNNRSEWMIASFALARIGAVQVLINTRLRTRDVAYVLQQSDTAVLVTHHRCGAVDYLAMVRELVTLPAAGQAVSDNRFPRLRELVLVAEDAPEGTTSWAQLLADGQVVTDAQLDARTAAIQVDDAVFIMYTSGTTGVPKGAVHTHQLIRNVEERAMRMAVTPNDVILNYLPLFHAFGYSEGALMSILSGACQVITETFDPSECLDLIARERASIIHGFEAHMKGLSEAQERAPRDLSSLRTGIFAAGMLSATPVARRGAGRVHDPEAGLIKRRSDLRAQRGCHSCTFPNFQSTSTRIIILMYCERHLGQGLRDLQQTDCMEYACQRAGRPLAKRTPPPPEVR